MAVPSFSGSLAKYPARASFAWYAGLVTLGALLLRLPMCRGSAAATRINILDAIFTSTSAACVTGLAVRDTGSDFSFIGQLVILGMIQLGGIGIMTVTTFTLLNLGTRTSLRHRNVIAETLGADERTDLRWVLRNVIITTFVCEAIGWLLLSLRFAFAQGKDFGHAIWSGLFHSVSAFCNAGFSLYSNSLTYYSDDPIVCGVVIALVVIGGLGFPVILDIFRHWKQPWGELWVKLSMHSKVMLIGTAALLAFSTVGIFLLEIDGVLAELPWWQKPIVAAFHAVSCRTAGFNTIDVATLSNATLFVSILLMLVGAGPCSTAGGFKVSTLMVLALHAWTRFRGGTHINFARRSIPSEAAGRATAVAMLFTVVMVVALTALLVIEQHSIPHRESKGLFMDALFETASALGTVGLSTGMTEQLSHAGRLIIIILMFLGRLGPISVFAAISSIEQRHTLEYEHEEPLLG
ncbi:MAG: hypothetical protein CMJ58_09725 [Planctomycetaceae bacterium]|nr:hypothetical protein [Planctomycetaceae bacterium]